MGIYDFFKGKCPKCGKAFGHDDDGQETGEIQSKTFSHMQEGHLMIDRYETNCFRTFTVGSKNGCFPKNACLRLEDTCIHCNSYLVAVFLEGELVRFEVAPDTDEHVNQMEMYVNQLTELYEKETDDAEVEIFKHTFWSNPSEFDFYVGEKFKDIQTTDFVSMTEGQEIIGEHDTRVFTVGTKNGCFPMHGCTYVDAPFDIYNKNVMAVFENGELIRFDCF